MQIAKDMQEGKLKQGELSKDAIIKTYQEINEGAESGYGKGWNADKNEAPSREAILLQRNIYKFSGAKTHVMLQELNSKLTKDGKIVPFEDFKIEALKLNKTYNLNYLQAEYQTATHSAKMAANWENYVRNTALFPNLKYKTQGDDQVRDDHKALDNKIAPVNSAFWNRYYPPNGWRCRCYAVQTAETASEELPTEIPTIKPEFENNAGKTKEIFNETGTKPHPFFSVSKRDAKGNSNLKKSFELSKRHAPNYKLTTPNNREIDVNIFAHDVDLKSNIKTAMNAVDTFNYVVKVNGHVDLKGEKNPELNFNSVDGDKVFPETKNIKSAVSNAFNNKLKKGGQLRDLKDTFIVIDLSNYQKNKIEDSIIDIARQTHSKLNHYKNISKVFYEYENKMIEIEKGKDEVSGMINKLTTLIQKK